MLTNHLFLPHSSGANLCCQTSKTAISGRKCPAVGQFADVQAEWMRERDSVIPVRIDFKSPADFLPICGSVALSLPPEGDHRLERILWVVRGYSNQSFTFSLP